MRSTTLGSLSAMVAGLAAGIGMGGAEIIHRSGHIDGSFGVGDRRFLPIDGRSRRERRANYQIKRAAYLGRHACAKLARKAREGKVGLAVLR